MYANKRFIRSFISVFLSLLLFVLVSLFTARLLLQVDNAALVIRDIDIAETFRDTEFAHYIVSQINSLPFNNWVIDINDVEVLIKNEAVSSEIEEILSAYISALNNNDLDYHITNGEVIDAVTRLEPEISRFFGHYMTAEDNLTLTRTLDDVIDFRGLTVRGILYDVGINPIVPRLIVSPFMIWGTGIFILITLCFIFLTNIDSISKAFLMSGIPIVISGVVYLLTGVVFCSYPDLLSGMLHTLSRLTGGIMLLVIRYGIVLTAIGVALIVVSLIIRLKNETPKKPPPRHLRQSPR